MDEKTQKSTESAAQSQPACEVYFDGDCPLCRAEIGLYQRSGAQARFTNIASGASEAPPEIGREAAMKRFHVRRSDGRLVSGAAAFAELWKATPGWRWLGHIAATPPIVWIAEGLYRVFLLVRPSLQRAVRTRA
jgi:predicted DCC family thiol-disulfide oxidoreductase YuxK